MSKEAKPIEETNFKPPLSVRWEMARERFWRRAGQIAAKAAVSLSQATPEIVHAGVYKSWSRVQQFENQLAYERTNKLLEKLIATTNQFEATLPEDVISKTFRYALLPEAPKQKLTWSVKDNVTGWLFDDGLGEVQSVAWDNTSGQLVTYHYQFDNGSLSANDTYSYEGASIAPGVQLFLEDLTYHIREYLPDLNGLYETEISTTPRLEAL